MTTPRPLPLLTSSKPGGFISRNHHWGSSHLGIPVGLGRPGKSLLCCRFGVCIIPFLTGLGGFRRNELPSPNGCLLVLYSSSHLEVLLKQRFCNVREKRSSNLLQVLICFVFF